jgi:hypothetical protein
MHMLACIPLPTGLMTRPKQSRQSSAARVWKQSRHVSNSSRELVGKRGQLREEARQAAAEAARRKVVVNSRVGSGDRVLKCIQR